MKRFILPLLIIFIFISLPAKANDEVKKGMKEALSQLQSSLEKVQRQEKGLKKGFF